MYHDLTIMAVFILIFFCSPLNDRSVIIDLIASHSCFTSLYFFDQDNGQVKWARDCDFTPVLTFLKK